jgi:hypothetical protein
MKVRHTLAICLALLLVGSVGYAGWTTFTSIKAEDDIEAGDDLTVGDDAAIADQLTLGTFLIDPNESTGWLEFSHPAYSATGYSFAEPIKLGKTSKINFNDDAEISVVRDDDDDDSTLVINQATDIEGSLFIESPDEAGEPALQIDQNDADQAFVQFNGTETADTAANVSTQPGDGAVVGPKAKGAASGWAFAKMLFIQVNNESTGYWIPAYSDDPL